jgi:hypothetical protein
MKTPLLLIGALYLAGCASTSATVQTRIVNHAKSWQEQTYRVGLAEQCMNWTREVLVAVCGSHFASVQTLKPWDLAQLGEGDELLPEHADSLAGDEFGLKVTELNDVQPGDLIFLKNTYGNWAPGVITHVGIATGNGNYIHRMTSNQGVVKDEAIPVDDFAYALRMDSKHCQAQ